MDRTAARQVRVGAYVVCVRDGAALLTRFTRSRRWTLPGGGIDHGEHPDAAAVREVAEETGYRIQLGKLVGVHSALWDSQHNDEPIDVHALFLLYTGEVVGGALRNEVHGSTDHAAWIPLDDIAGLDHTSIIDIGLAAADNPVS
jgi:8-oxo-dGTP pyrophosphatase MutT (NUDIX family)